MDRTLTLILGDLHMGTGAHGPGGKPNQHEDFRRDEEFARLVSHAGRGDEQTGVVRLVINGDFLDVLLSAEGVGPAARLTAGLALARAAKGVDGHPVVFRALSRFAGRSGRSVHFVAGNHDPDLLLPDVQRLLRERIGGRVVFHPAHFEQGDLLVEHGHLYDTVNGLDPAAAWIADDEDGEPYLDLPIGSLLARHLIAPMKQYRPSLHRIKPVGRYVRWCLTHDADLCGRVAARSVRLAFRFLVGRERAHAARALHLARRNTRRILAVNRFHLYESIARTLLALPGLSTVVFGHTHRPVETRLPDGKTYLNPGTWSEVLRLEGRDLRPDGRLFVARVLQENGRTVDARLLSWA